MKNALPVNYISHPLLTENCIESRIYQQKILARAIHNNTIIVLPAGIGKTVIATLVIAYYLQKNMANDGRIDSKCLFLTSTKPLVLKRTATLQEKLTIPKNITFLMGSISSERRVELFWRSNVLVMTPQTLYNDLNNGLYDLSDVSLIIFDECHRATGNHAYVKAAEHYFAQNKNGRVLGLTASLGSARIAEEVCDNLRIQFIESGDKRDSDVKSFLPHQKSEYRMIPLPKIFQDMRTVLEDSTYNFIEKLIKKGVVKEEDPRKVTITKLVDLQTEYQSKLNVLKQRSTKTVGLKVTIAQIASCIRFLHIIERIEAEGLSSAKRFIDKLRERAVSNKQERMLRRFCNLASVKKVYQMIEQGLQEGYEHPKLVETAAIIKKQLSEKSDSRILVFANYRASINAIVDVLSNTNDKRISAAGLVGHKHKGTIGGLSSKQQMKLLKHFKEGIINVLVATSVAEQGLDIIDSDLVIFYDCVPDQIRAHQRCNRTVGKVIILITKGTVDERYYWVVREAEKKLKSDIN